MKGKLSGAKLQGFLWAHGEKIVVGVVVVGVVFLFYKALGVESYTKTPEDLARVTNSAKSHIERTISSAELTVAVNSDGELEVQDYSKIADSGEPVDPRQAGIGGTKWRPSDSASGRRPVPDILAVEELRAVGSNGTFAMTMTPREREAREAEKMRLAAALREEQAREREEDERDRPRGEARRRSPRVEANADYDNLLPGGEGDHLAMGPDAIGGDLPERPRVSPPADSKAQGFRWVVLTGLVPLRKQTAEFRDKFEETGNGLLDTDFPEYVHFEVERAEVVPGQAAENRTWTPVDVWNNSVALEEQYAIGFPSDCELMFQDPVLTRLLPPLLLRYWDDTVVHQPTIEWMKLGSGRFDEMRRGEEAEVNRGNVKPLMADADGQPGGNQLLRQAGGLLGGARRLGNSHGDEEDEGRGNRPGRRSNRPNHRRANPGNVGGGMSAQAAEFALFRFFDFSVDPGKSYVYQVRLQLYNPNYGLPSHMLEDAASGRAEHAFTPWTELAETVKVPNDIYMLAGEAALPRGTKGPTAKAIIKNFDFKQGLLASEEFTLFRGAIAGNTGRNVKVIDPITRQIKDQRLDFDTGTVVLDIIGGEPMGQRNRDKAPGMLLLLDESGNLVVREELTDQQTYSQSKAELERIADAVNPPMRDDEFESAK